MYSDRPGPIFPSAATNIKIILHYCNEKKISHFRNKDLST